MSDTAESLWRLAAKVDEAAGALRRAELAEFAEMAAELESADVSWAARGDDVAGDSATQDACVGLQRSLDRLGALLGHVAGVQQALAAVDPVHGAVYDRSGSGVDAERTTVHEEA